METGHRLGPYEILEQLGVGGMGEVWLAEDTRLGRKVAIKVLPVEFAADPERLARFAQEARAAAALNHPHIAAVHDVGHEDGVHFMVQEFLPGESLADALQGGPLPLDRALSLATEIGEALKAAHEAGIVHRDLKPDNVFVSVDGHAKVLDFGLAKLTEAAAMSGGSATMSPTVLGTQAGVIMGTAGYMAPEQVNGQGVDHRADIFAFGCLLYEMVSGARAFGGETVVDSLHAITRTEPEALRSLEGHVPADLQRLVDKCLRKDPVKRYQHADDLVVDLRVLAADVEAGTALPALDGASGADTTTGRAGLSAGKMATVVALAVVITAAATWFASRPEAPSPGPVRRFRISLPEGTRTSQPWSRSLDISPDGTTLAFVADEQLWLRRLDQIGAVPLSGTAGAVEPTFSPDGQHVAFSTSGEVRRVSISAGTVIVIGTYEGNVADGLYWGDDGFVYVGGEPEGVVRLPESGGPPNVVTKIEHASLGYAPRLLPGGRWLLITVADAIQQYGAGRVLAVSLDTDERRVLVIGGQDARLTPTGHLLWVQSGVLWAQAFDAEDVELYGDPVAMVPGIRTSVGGFTGAAHYTVSNDGTLAYVQGSTGDRSTLEVVWVDREGETSALPFETRNFNQIALSPDGTRVAAVITDVNDPGIEQIWLYDIDRPRGQRLTSEGRNNRPVWSPDGQWVYYTSGFGDTGDIWRRRADLSGEAERVAELPGLQWPGAFSADGEWLAYSDNNTDSGNWNIGLLPVSNTNDAELVVDDGAREWLPSISPDGAFVVYQSNEASTDDIYVKEIASGRRWLISESGGVDASWSRDGTEIFYSSNQERRYVVPVTVQPEFSHGQPQLLFTFDELVLSSSAAADGDRFLEIRDTGGIDGAGGQQIRIVLNWFEELKARVPTDR